MKVLANRLATAPGLYLRQHADNPVHWQPWDDEALAYARKEQKLLLISIGYAACHWCHVMEHECFEDMEVAALMNEHFVPVKVDRESRPDLDAIYMDALQLMSGKGGWPLNVVALPDGRPVYGGTYFPKKQWLDVLSQIAGLWEQEPERVMSYADRLQSGLREMNELVVSHGDVLPGMDFYERGFEQVSHRLDYKYGGLSQAPKFPMPPLLRYLLHYGSTATNQQALEAALLTADRMAAGGLYDQLGGGFARYSVDAYWAVPHFEKMLYDNAQLISFYAEAYRYSRKSRYRDIVTETIHWCKEALLQDSGVYAAAWDADSEGEEGKYYVWTARELAEVLSPADLQFATIWFGIGKDAVWEGPLQVLQEAADETQLAEYFKFSASETQNYKSRIRQILLEVRNKRVAPACDRKQLLGWNGLFLEGLAEAYVSLADDQYLADAISLAENLLHFETEGVWHRVCYESRYVQTAFSEDLVYAATGFFRLFQVSGQLRWLQVAQRMTELLQASFADPTTGLLTQEPLGGGLSFARKFELADNVQPSVNSAYARLLFQLSEIRLDNLLREKSLQLFRYAVPHLEKYSHYYAGWAALGLWSAQPLAVVTVTGPDARQAFLELSARYLPQQLLLFSEKEVSVPEIMKERFVETGYRIDRCIFGSCALAVFDTAEHLRA